MFKGLDVVLVGMKSKADCDSAVEFVSSLARCGVGRKHGFFNHPFEPMSIVQNGRHFIVSRTKTEIVCTKQKTMLVVERLERSA